MLINWTADDQIRFAQAERVRRLLQVLFLQFYRRQPSKSSFLFGYCKEWKWRLGFNLKSQRLNGNLWLALIPTDNSNHPALQAFTLCISASKCSLHLCLCLGAAIWLCVFIESFLLIRLSLCLPVDFLFDAFESHVVISHGQPPEERIYKIFKHDWSPVLPTSSYINLPLLKKEKGLQTRRYHLLLTFSGVINRILAQNGTRESST